MTPHRTIPVSLAAWLFTACGGDAAYPQVIGASPSQQERTLALLAELADELGDDVIRAIHSVSFSPTPLDHRESAGRFLSPDMRIELDARLTDDALEEVLRHEVCHAFVELRGLPDTWTGDPKGWLSEDYEALTVRARRAEVDARLCDLGVATLERLASDGTACLTADVAARLDAVLADGLGIVADARAQVTAQQARDPLGRAVFSVVDHWPGPDTVAVRTQEPSGWSWIDLTTRAIHVPEPGDGWSDLFGVQRETVVPADEHLPVRQRVYTIPGGGEARVDALPLPDGSEVSLLSVGPEGKPVPLAGHCLPGSASVTVATSAVVLAGVGDEAFWYDLSPAFDAAWGTGWRVDAGDVR